MFVFKKIVTAFLVPPGIFIALLLGAGGFFFVRKDRREGLFLCCLAFLMWLGALPPLRNVLLREIETDVHRPAVLTGDVIVVLGGGIYDRASDLTGRGAPGKTATERILTAARLYRQLKLPIIVTGGRMYGHLNSEADISHRFLLDLGISARHILIEDQSRDTYENARNTRPILEQHGFKHPILITSAFHMPRAVLCFEQNNIKVTPCPSLYRSQPNRTYGWNDFLPHSYEPVRLAIKEYLGLLYTRLIH